MDTFFIPALATPPSQFHFVERVPLATMTEAELKAGADAVAAAPAAVQHRARRAVRRYDRPGSDRTAALYQLDAAVHEAVEVQRRHQAAHARRVRSVRCGQAGGSAPASSGTGGSGSDSGEAGAGDGGGDDDGGDPPGRPSTVTTFDLAGGAR